MYSGTRESCIFYLSFAHSLTRRCVPRGVQAELERRVMSAGEQAAATTAAAALNIRSAHEVHTPRRCTPTPGKGERREPRLRLLKTDSSSPDPP
jgi:hypothetical protein